MLPQLSHYTQFYVALSGMMKSNSITDEQKGLLKQQLIKKEPQLCRTMIELGGKGMDSKLRDALCEYVVNLQKLSQKPYVRKTTISRTVIDRTKQHLFPSQKIDQQIFQDEQTSDTLLLNEECLNSSTKVLVKQLTSKLQQHFEKSGKLSEEDLTSMKNLQELVNNLLSEKNDMDNLSNQARFSSVSEIEHIKEVDDADSSEEDKQSHLKIIQQIKQDYKILKQVYYDVLQTHILLMQDEVSIQNLMLILKQMIKNLIDADNFIFFYKRDDNIWQVQSTSNVGIENVSSQVEFQTEVNAIECDIVNSSESLKLFPLISKKLQDNSSQESYLLKFINKKHVYLVIFQWSEAGKTLKSRFVKDANKYGCCSDIVNLGKFLTDTILNTQVQSFKPSQLADQILDIGLNFLHRAYFLLAQLVKKALKDKYKVEKQQQNSNFKQYSYSQDEYVKIEFKSLVPITLLVKDMDLSNSNELQTYNEIIVIKEQFYNYLRFCHEKSVFYKYFIRNRDSLLFEFNKKGELIFLSRPITNKTVKQHVNFNPQFAMKHKMSYHELFTGQALIQDIENNLQNIQKYSPAQNLGRSNHPFDIFLKVIDDSYKGFVIILHEHVSQITQNNYLTLDSLKQKVQRRSQDGNGLEEEIHRTIRTSLKRQNEYTGSNDFELSNVEVKNSMISLFIPEFNSNDTKRSQDPVRTIVSSTEINSRVIQYSPAIKEFKNPTSVKFIQYDKKKVIKKSFFFEKIIDEQVLDKFEFNIFDYPKMEDKQRIIYGIIRRNKFDKLFNINLDTLSNFLQQVEKKYNKLNNPFHNFDHGIAVMQSCHFLNLCKKTKFYIDDLTRFATIISGLCHDVNHSGRSNLFEINSRSKLSLRYHDRSPLEQHHAATTMFILQDEMSNIIQNISFDDQKRFRKIFIENILYTDIKMHFALLKEFECSQLERCEEMKPFGQSDEDLKLLTGMIVHTADFNGGAKVFEISKKWSEKVNLEFMAQYEEEGALNIPQTVFLKDLDKIHIMAKSEIGFFKVIVRPLWDTLNNFCVFQIINQSKKDNELETSLKNLDNTIVSWDKIYQANIPNLT